MEAVAASNGGNNIALAQRIAADHQGTVLLHSLGIACVCVCVCVCVCWGGGGLHLHVCLRSEEVMHANILA